MKLKKILVVCMMLVGAGAPLAWAGENALQDGLQVGGRWGYYRYSENPNFMELEGSRALSVEGAYQRDLELPWVGTRALRFEGRLGESSDGYSSASGFTNGNKSRVMDTRALLVGRMDLGPVTFNPYVGYGYRRLQNDLKATGGYTRVSQYHYMPLGTWVNVPLGEGVDSFVGQMEYAPLIVGYQHSAIGSGVDNTQNSGSHVRLFGGWKHGRYQVGPYAEFWQIGESSVDCESGGFCGLEPRNFTREVGLRMSVQFGGDTR